MQKKSLALLKGSKELKIFSKKIKSGKYFRKIKLMLLEKMLIHGEFVSLNKNEFLIKQKKNNSPELIILVEGSLVVKSENYFVKRLNQSGDVFGEMSVTFSKNNIFFDIIAEKKTEVIVFKSKVFEINNNAEIVPIAYLILSNILAEKISYDTAQSFLKNNLRKLEKESPVLYIIDPNNKSRKKIRSLIRSNWEKTDVVEINSFPEEPNELLQKRVDLFIIDPGDKVFGSSKNNSIRKFIEKCSFQKIPILAISKLCTKETNRKFLSDLGVSDFLIKPFSDFDLSHKLKKFRSDHYLQKELEQVEIDADTDRLTGLANRRKMDEFLDVLFTISIEDKKPFTIIIADIDNFKHYNDRNGHQLGDEVLSLVASILKSKIRRGDLAVRYGGEEFVLIFPNCSKNHAIKIGNKLRNAIAEEKFPFQEKQPSANLTCTFGLATFPQDAVTKELLFKKADKNLYIGKSNGKNQLVAYNKKNKN